MKNQRQNQILQLLLVQNDLKTEYLVNHFGVSMETIRRDINDLEKIGLIKKVYGGVSLASSSRRMTTLEEWNVRLNSCHNEKAKLASAALDYIEDGSVLALDIGTTTYELALLLAAKKDLTIITNSLFIASELSKNSSHNIYAIGGAVIAGEEVTSGIFARYFLDNFGGIDIFIGSADGISVKCGITEYSEGVVDIKRQLVQRAKKRIALIDHSKFGKEAMFVSWPLEDIDLLLTDELSPSQDLEFIEKMGTKVILVK